MKPRGDGEASGGALWTDEGKVTLGNRPPKLATFPPPSLASRPASPKPFAVTCDSGCAGGGDALGIVGFTGERRRLVQAWGRI